MPTPEEFFEGFDTEENFAKAIEIHHWGVRFPSGAFKKDLIPFCPHCNSVHVKRLKTTTVPNRFQCNECRKQFNVLKGTPFYRSKTSLRLWFFIYWYKKHRLQTEEISEIINMKKRDIENILSKLEAKDRELGKSYLNKIRLEYLHYSRIWLD